MKKVRISEMLAEMVNTIKSGKVKSWIYRQGFDSNNAYKMLPASEKSYSIKAVDDMIVNNSWICYINTMAKFPAYSPSSNTVYIPCKDRYSRETEIQTMFGDEHMQNYYCDLFHEMAHSTSDMGIWSYQRKIGKPFGDRLYAREEILAESTALVISKLFDFSPSLQKSSIFYIDGWIKALREDADFLLDKTLQEDIKNAANIIISHINAQCNKPILPKLI